MTIQLTIESKLEDIPTEWVRVDETQVKAILRDLILDATKHDERIDWRVTAVR